MEADVFLCRSLLILLKTENNCAEWDWLLPPSILLLRDGEIWFLMDFSSRKLHSYQVAPLYLLSKTLLWNIRAWLCLVLSILISNLLEWDRSIFSRIWSKLIFCVTGIGANILFNWSSSFCQETAMSLILFKGIKLGRKDTELKFYFQKPCCCHCIQKTSD